MKVLLIAMCSFLLTAVIICIFIFGKLLRQRKELLRETEKWIQLSKGEDK